MKKLGKANYNLISLGIRTEGTFNPDDIFYLFEEQLLACQIDRIYNFLKWCHNNKKTFGSGNYEQVFSEYLKSI
jgi:hypothetical protein